MSVAKVGAVTFQAALRYSKSYIVTMQALRGTHADYALFDCEGQGHTVKMVEDLV